jgi:hypothetical protein
VEGVHALVQSWRYGRESGEDGRGVGTACEKSSEASTVGFTACIYTGGIDVVGRGNGGDHVVDISDLVKVSWGNAGRGERRDPTSSTVVFSYGAPFQMCVMFQSVLLTPWA